MPLPFQAEKFQSTESLLLEKSSHAFDHPCSYLNVFEFHFIFFWDGNNRITHRFKSGSNHGVIHEHGSWFTVLLSGVFLVTPNFWFAFYLLLSTELTSSWKYMLMFHPLVAMVSTELRSSIPMRNGNSSLCALLCTYLHWILSVNLVIHHSVHSESAFILINLISLYHLLMLLPDCSHPASGHLQISWTQTLVQLSWCHLSALKMFILTFCFFYFN